jgi:pyruvate carboxylase
LQTACCYVASTLALLTLPTLRLHAVTLHLFHSANRLLGDIIKVTPSSKVTGDLAQWMVQNDLTEEQVLERAETLSFPSSVVEYFQGYLGLPPFGFPEPLRSKVLKSKTLPNGKQMFEGRPGAEMSDYDFAAAKEELEAVHGKGTISEGDLLSHAQYPVSILLIVYNYCHCYCCYCTAIVL